MLNFQNLIHLIHQLIPIIIIKRPKVVRSLLNGLNKFTLANFQLILNIQTFSFYSLFLSHRLFLLCHFKILYSLPLKGLRVHLIKGILVKMDHYYLPLFSYCQIAVTQEKLNFS